MNKFKNNKILGNWKNMYLKLVKINKLEFKRKSNGTYQLHSIVLKQPSEDASRQSSLSYPESTRVTSAHFCPCHQRAETTQNTPASLVTP